MTAVDTLITNIRNYRASADSAPLICDADLMIAALDQLAQGGGSVSLTHNNIFVGTVANSPGDVPMSGDATIVDTGAVHVLASGGVAFGSAAFASTAAFDAAGAAATAQANAETFATGEAAAAQAAAEATAANSTNQTSGTLDDARLSTNAKTQALTFIIDGGGIAITTGIKRDLICPYACTVVGWTIVADVAGAITIDLWKDTFANYPPTNADSMPGAGTKPNIPATNAKAIFANLTSWNTAIAAGDIIRPNVDSCATITAITLILTVVKT